MSDFPELYSSALETLDSAAVAYQEIVAALMKQGRTRKQAREAARHVLPGGIATEFIVTGNLRAFRDVLGKRLSPHADAEIQEFARQTLMIAKSIAPNIFQDFEEEGE